MDLTSPPLHIQTMEALYQHLQAAVELEHSTIPPYLCAMYTIKPGTNREAAEIIRTVVVEEMLHMILAGNVLNAIGGAPSIDDPLFVPDYPATLPIGTGAPLIVNLLPFSEHAIDTFLAIEHPAIPAKKGLVAAAVPVEPGQIRAMLRRGELYESIGEFYAAIEQALIYFEQEAQRQGKTIFTGELSRQITREQYYASGGEAFAVTDLSSALDALQVIVDQGEGFDTAEPERLLMAEGEELGHYYRFMEIKRGRRYVKGDSPNNPTGPTIPVDYGPDAVWAMIANPKTAKYPLGQVRERSVAFNQTYTGLLRLLHQAFNGEPEELVPAVVQMFSLKEAALGLIKNPVPGQEARYAGPSFEYA